jgi:SSS family solute:Na+ symporter
MRYLSVLLALTLSCAAHGVEPALQHESLPPLPEAVAGHFGGTIRNIVVLAGGNSHREGTAYWHQRVYRLDDIEPRIWNFEAQLPGPRSDGVSIEHGDSLLLVGGSNGRAHLADIVQLTVNPQGNLAPAPFQTPMPEPMAFGGGARAGDVLYVTCGQRAPGGEATNTLWSLNLADPEAQWQQHDPLPGEARIQPAVTAINGTLYVAGGAATGRDGAGIETRRILDDAWAYTPGKGWRSLAPMPIALAGAPNASIGGMHWLLFGGDAGQLPGQDQLHPGYARDVLAYTPVLGTWRRIGLASEAVIGAPAVPWKGSVVLPGGEDRPLHRSTGAYMSHIPVAHETLNWLDWAMITLYLAGMLGIGFYFTGKQRNTERFFLGNRRIPWWAVGLSIFGTAISAITYLSIPARAFATDWTMVFANLAILFVAPLVVCFYIPAFRRMDITTAYEFLERRFNFGLRLYGSLCFLLFQFGRISVVLFLPALALSATTGMDTTTSILIMGMLTTVYTVMGGIEAVIWTDVVQSIVLVAGAVLAFVLVVLHVDGGLGEIISAGQSAGKFNLVNPTWSYAADALWVILLGNIFANFYPATADQTIVQRYLTTADEKSAARATWTNALLTLPITFLFFGLGTALWAYFRQHPLLLPPGMRNDAVLPVFMMAEFPAGIRGIFISGIFAAAMSSLSSSINSISQVLVTDYYRRFIHPSASEQVSLRAAQLLTLLFGVAATVSAIYIARINAVSLWDPFLALLGLAGGGLAGIFALGIFVRRANGKGAVAGAIASAATLFFVVNYTQTSPFLYGMTGFLVSLLIGWIGSILSTRLKPETA